MQRCYIALHLFANPGDFKVTAPIEPPPVKHVVLLLHGIESEGEWMQEVQAALQTPSIRVAPIKIGRVSVTRFLFWNRSDGPIGLTLGGYLEALQAFPGARISVIAHSFGTYIVAKTLLRYP